MNKLEMVARVIAWEDIKDEPASMNYETGEKKFMRDITTHKDILYVEPKYFTMALAAMKALKIDDASKEIERLRAFLSRSIPLIEFASDAMEILGQGDRDACEELLSEIRLIVQDRVVT